MKKSEINILIIDDDKSMQASLSELVKRRGYRAVVVSKPDEAESLVKIKPIHGVIADVMLPGRNGVDTVLRLKENLMENAAIIFVSGIYKDKTFASEAIKKTDAIDYLVKPFSGEELISKLDKRLSQYMDAPKMDLHTLLASPFASERERRKALDHVEEMKGYDLPFVLCILMDSESSGHLNIVDENQSIFGITFAKGTISKVDSEAITLLTKKILVQHGFITELELGELKSAGGSGDIVKSLVEKGLISPHVTGIIKSEAIINEIKKIVNDKTIKINFVPDRKIKSESDNIDMGLFINSLHQIIDQQIPYQWLKSFYTAWMGHPIKAGPQFADQQKFASLSILEKAKEIMHLFKNESTIEDILALVPNFSEENFYRALHFLMLRRVLVFEEAKRVKNLDEHVNRLKSIHLELKDKNPIQVFQYFGLSDNPKAADVVRIYKEFAKSHHPDTLPKTVSKDIRDLNHDLFSKVTAAYEVLSDETKKIKFFEEIKHKETELQIKSDELITQAAQLLNRGKYSEGLHLATHF